MNKVITFSFCEPFITNLMRYLDETYLAKGQDLSRLAICFGGKRPALFVKRDLAHKIKGAFYSPKFFSIDEFISYSLRKQELFGQTLDLDSCYLMYQLAKTQAPHILKGRETFAQFLPWAREILSFIDQLDLENIDDKSLKNVESNAQIGYAVPDDINRLLEQMVVLRKAYHGALEEQQMYSRGLQYFRASKMIDQITFDEFDQILFCNFFYFNRSEEKIIKSLYDRNQATLIFQGDQRRWPVLQRIARTLDASIVEGDEPKRPEFNLQLYQGFDAHSQVGLVREVLKKVEDPKRTVIVLPNPDNIIVLLSEITKIVQEFNISLGYPLKRSSLFHLFEFVFQAQLSKKAKRYYSKDYLKALHHPFIKNLNVSSNATITRTLVHKIEEVLIGKEKAPISGSLFVELKELEACDELFELTMAMLNRLGIESNISELQSILSEIHQALFVQWEDMVNFKMFSDVLDGFIELLITKSFLKDYPLNLNIATKLFAIKDEFLTSSFAEEEFLKEDMFRIFKNKVEKEIVAFHGQPLKGLQLLGLEETRSLNFDHVIILDVNEGILPKLHIFEPLIPRDVKIGLKLDRLELEEEIQRYHFMRLLSSAKDVHLIYQESKDKEKSRFVQELVWEEQKHKQDMNVLPITQASFDVKIEPTLNRVKKTPEMIEALKVHKFSASSINMYLRNPMEFYQNYVLGLREQEDLLDEPEARHVGTFVHELLEHSFTPFLKKAPQIDQSFREHFARSFDQKFNETFGKQMRSDSFLLKSILSERMNRFLDNEAFNKARAVEQIMYLENRFDDTIELAGEDIRFGYIVDRVDRLKDGTIMIIDYKTGSADVMPRAIEHIRTMELSRQSIREHVKSFQIPLYFHYLNKTYKDQPINAGLYSLRTIEIKPFIDHKMTYNREVIDDAFMRALDFIMQEILNPKIDFVEDNVESYF